MVADQLVASLWGKDGVCFGSLAWWALLLVGNIDEGRGVRG